MKKQKTAILSGVSGQDGSYLAEFLLKKKYKVVGIYRHKAIDGTEKIKHLIGKKDFIIEGGDITDKGFIDRLIKKYKPDYYINLGAMSFVEESFRTPYATLEINTASVIHALEAIKDNSPKTKFYQASTSEMFGGNPDYPFTENSEFHPNSPYAIAKTASHYFVKLYREAYGLFACSGILFNHESTRRGEHFATRKISLGIAKIKCGFEKYLYLGNLDAKRDWGYAPEFVEMMWRMLQQKTPSDYIVATGELHSVKEFLKETCKLAGLDWKKVTKISKKHIRPLDVQLLVGDISKAKKELGWKPKVKFKELVKIMYEEDLKKLKNETKEMP